jgi:nitroimidazol reductase NimA-like FMN-containing flavoprotein (pyridoxamine 5'-phosphate oxidase superfamily)
MTTTPELSAGTELEELSEEECRRLLGYTAVGRIAFVVDSRAVLFPVNYRLLSAESGLSILLRTRPGNAIDGAPKHVAFEVDGIDESHQQGWSVLARGVLHHLDRNEIDRLRYRFDPKPWPHQERTSWLAVKLQTITGRRLHPTAPEWALPSEAYL